MLESSRQKKAEHEQFEKEKEKEKLSCLKFSIGDRVISDAYRYTPTRQPFF